jgi:hypothetical protein
MKLSQSFVNGLLDLFKAFESLVSDFLTTQKAVHNQGRG